MKLRALKTGDFFKMSKILKKMELKIETKGKTQEQLGAELILKVMENLHMAEKEVNQFMAGLCGLSVEAFENLEMTELMSVFEQFKEMDGVKSFLSKVNP